MIIVIGTVISLGTSWFYGADIDIRKVEADILGERIIDCILEQGVLVGEFQEEGFDLYDFCDLNKESFGKESNFYFNVSLFDDAGVSIKEIKGGKSFEIQCGVKEGGSEVKGGAECFRYKRNMMYHNQNQEIKIGILEILTGSNQN
ncbi:MAG: hypothetical protein ABIB47_02205 [Candidatus Woesearchaeota archaeon]